MSESVKRVALLGTGIMGAGMGRNLVDAGLEVRVWNRTREKAEEIDDAAVTDSPADAVAGADAVITMLSGPEAVREVMAGDDGALAAMDDGAVWIQSSTIGLAATDEMAELAADAGTPFIDAPVLGTRKPAEDGALIVLAAGDHAGIERCGPVFDAIGSKTVEFGAQPGAAMRMKLAINAWVLTLTVNVAETMALADALQVDSERLLEILDGNPVGSPYAQLKGKLILGRDFEPPSFALEGAAKDLGLIVAAADEAGIDLGLAPTALRRFEEAIEMGKGELDMAAVYETVSQRDDARPAAAA